MAQAVREVEGDGRFPVAGLDSLPPPEIARKAESVGETKAAMPAATVFALAVLAGAFIALGAIFSTTVAAGGSDLPYGVVRLSPDWRSRSGSSSSSWRAQSSSPATTSS
jgi:hypothetical protein